MFEKTENQDFAERAIEIETEETEVLKTLLKKQNKQLFYTRISSIAMVIFVAVMTITCITVVPTVMKTVDRANDIMIQAQNILEDVDESLEAVDKMTAEITSAASGINTMVDDNAGVMSDAMNKINGVDFEGLNSAIKDLQDVIEPMANFMNKFR